ncbi:DUF4124 domain-containing protein [Beggiatoa alba]|nr:DUF4124 domain-containing protein [Beggiatoa alba]
MMIRFLIIILIVLVGGAALTELNPGAEQSTNPILKGLGTVRSWFDDATTSIPLMTPDANETKVYKWQDDSGAWHFSNNPPPVGVNGSVEIYRSDINITQAPPPIEIMPKPANDTAAIPDSPSPLLPITDPGRVKQLIEDAKNVQNRVTDRQKNIEQSLNP